MNSSVFVFGGGLRRMRLEEDERFRRIVAQVLAIFGVAALVVPWLPLPPLDRPTVVSPAPPPMIVLETPRRPPPPPSVPAQPHVVEAKPPSAPRAEVTPPPKPASRSREQLSNVGVLALRDELADLRETRSVNRLAAAQTKVRAEEGRQTTVDRRVIARRAGEGSGGIDVARLSRDSGGVELQAHVLVEVNDVVVAAEGTGPRAGQRSEEDVRLVLQTHKGRFDLLYNRALRDNPALKGRVVFELTIAPSGIVAQCRIVSDELRDPALERKFLLVMKSLDFGAKDADTTVVTYWLDFL